MDEDQGSTEVAEEIGAEVEGRVLQAIAGLGNHYVMIVLEIQEDDSLKIRVPTNLEDSNTIKALLLKAAASL